MPSSLSNKFPTCGLAGSVQHCLLCSGMDLALSEANAIRTEFRMYKGIYVGLSGAVLRHQQIDVVAQNLANVSATGYKRDRMSFRSYMLSEDLAQPAPALYPESKTMATLNRQETDFTPGEIFYTGNTLDVAIFGDAFFSVRTPEGDRYTRNGTFKLDGSGGLVTSDGYQVLSESGPIVLPKGGQIAISQNGRISVDGVSASSLKLVGLKDPVKQGASLFSGSPVEVDAEVKQGALEHSNVNAFREMIGLVEAMRIYETNQKMIQAFDTLASKAANELARV